MEDASAARGKDAGGETCFHELFCTISIEPRAEILPENRPGCLPHLGFTVGTPLTHVIDDKVFGLEISVSDALLVHVAQCIDNHRTVEQYMFWW